MEEHTTNQGPETLEEGGAILPAATPVERARTFYEERPLACIGGAVALGYVLGGGVNTPMTRKILTFGAQKFLIPALKKQALGVLGVSEDS